MVLLTDFKDSWTCGCGGYNAKQDIRTVACSGRIYRLCETCSQTTDVYLPAETRVLKTKTVISCTRGCNCTDCSMTLGSMNCNNCGHLNVVHMSKQVPVESVEIKERVKKSELKESGLSFNVDELDDIQPLP